jgi:hypothetical protein
MSLQERRKFRIQCRLICGAESHVPFSRQCHQPRRDSALIEPLPRREEFCNDFTAIGHQHVVAGPDLANIFAQTVLQFSKPYAFHDFNVAS